MSTRTYLYHVQHIVQVLSTGASHTKLGTCAHVALLRITNHCANRGGCSSTAREIISNTTKINGLAYLVKCGSNRARR